MTNILDLSIPEQRKANVVKLLLELLRRRNNCPLFPKEEDQQMQNTIFMFLCLEYELKKLYAESPNELKSLFPPHAHCSLDLIYKNGPSQWPCIIGSEIDLRSNLSFLSYYVDRSNQEEAFAIKSLCRKFGIRFTSLACSITDSFFCCKETERLVFNDSSQFTLGFAFFSSPQISLPICSYEQKPEIKKLPLFNLHLIKKNPDAAVFLLSSVKLADALQRDAQDYCRENFIKKLKMTANDYIEKTKNTNEFEIACYNNIGDTASASNHNANYRPKIRIQEGFVAKFDDMFKSRGSYGPLLSTDVVFSTCYGDNTIESMDFSDLSVLKGHPIFYVFPNEDEIEWIKKTFPIINKLREAEVGDIYFLKAEASIDTVNVNMSGLEVISATEVLRKAIELELDIKDVAPSEVMKTFEKNRKVDKKKFLIDNILDRQSVLLLSAPSGVGKSIFAMNLGYALATKGKLINGWTVNERCKVLYLYDSELDERTLSSHREKFEKLYNCKNEEVDFIPEKAYQWQLMDNEYKLKLEKLIEEYGVTRGTTGLPVSVVIFDSLNRLASGVHHEKNWENFSLWLTELRQKGLSIILVHHSAKDARSDYLGSSKILNDVDVHIYLKSDSRRSVQPGNIAINMQIRKNRRSWADRKIKILTLSWGKHPCWRDEAFELLNWRARPDTRVKNIIKMRNEGLSAKEIGAKYNVSFRTVEKFISDHPEIPKLNKKRNN